MSSPEAAARQSLPPLVVILGPTAVGKTELALALASRLNGEIVSADSRLFYRGMDILTGKPTPAERRLVPHHLIDVAEPDQVWSLALFQSAAHQVIAEITQRGRLPFLVGGTGQYVSAITQGWSLPGTSPHPRLRLALERWAAEVGSPGLHQRLSYLDEEAAAAIEPGNLRRTIRALEVIFSSGRLFSAQRLQGVHRYATLLIGLTRTRSDLYARIDQRIQSMLDSGAVAEVRRLLDQGYYPSLPTMSAIGYQELTAYLQGSLSFAEAVALVKRRTRVFVRRQANWFKPTDPDIHWYPVSAGTLEAVEALINTWLIQQSLQQIPPGGNSQKADH